MGTPVYVGNIAILYEVPSSPVIELAETLTKTRTYTGVYSLCESSALPRGTAGTGAETGFLVSKSSVVRERGNLGKLTVVWQAGGEDSSQPLPSDSIDIAGLELNPKLERHPYFADLTDKELHNCRKAVSASSETERNTAATIISTSGSTEAQKLLELLKRGTENYYLAGIKYQWLSHSHTMPAGTLGGFVQAPGGPGASALPSGSWLRLSDSLAWMDSYWRITRTWIGGPDGHWDAVIYG